MSKIITVFRRLEMNQRDQNKEQYEDSMICKDEFVTNNTTIITSKEEDTKKEVLLQFKCEEILNPFVELEMLYAKPNKYNDKHNNHLKKSNYTICE